MTFSPFEKGLGYKTFFPKFVVNGNWLIFFFSVCSFMTQLREFRPNKLCNIPTLTIWISRIYLPSPVNSIFLCLRKHTCNYHPYTCLDTTFALTKICLLCVKTNYKFSLSFQNHERFQTFKFIYSEKATKFWEISTLLLTGATYIERK